MKKLVFILLAVCQALYAVRYQDILENGPFAQSFAQYGLRADKIRHLLNVCQFDGKEYRLEITDVPVRDGRLIGAIALRITNIAEKDAENEIEFYPVELGERIWRLSIDTDAGDNSMLWGAAAPGAIIAHLSMISASEAAHEIAGSTVMALFDRLCTLCSVGTSVLHDASSMLAVQSFNNVLDISDEEELGDIRLMVLMPYLYGTTFYERFGYRPDTSTRGLQRYLDARTDLINRPLVQVVHDFHDQPEVLQALKQGYQLLEFFPNLYVPLAQATLRHALIVPYLRALRIDYEVETHFLKREGMDITGYYHEDYLKILDTIYRNCLENYEVTDAHTASVVERKQMLMNGITNLWIKEYR